MFQDIASLEASILSLDAKSIMVLSKLHETETDEEIIEWSGGWNYTQKDIDRSMGRITLALGLANLSCPVERRKAAAEKFVAYSKFRNSEAMDCHQPYKRKSNMEETENRPIASAHEISIDTISPVAVKIARLSNKRQDIVRCLASDMKPEQIARELDLSLSTVNQYKSVIFSELQLPRTLGTKNRLRILKEAWELHFRTKKPPIAESTRKLTSGMSLKTESLKSEPAQSKKTESELPTSVPTSGSLPTVFFDDPSSVIGVQVIAATGQIPAEIIASGYRSEALVASHGKSSHNATAFLVMVLRK